MRGFDWKWVAGVAAALCVVVIVGAVVRWPLDLSSGKSRPPSQATVATRLAKQLTTARTPAKRYQALLSMMRAMHVGVYKANGRAIVRGAERSAKDLYVYEYTLRGLAAGMTTNQSVTVGQLAGRLDATVARVKKRRKITADRLRSALISTVRWARGHVRSGQAFPSLLLRELVRRRDGQDLAKPPVAASMSLRTLEAFLVTVDFTAGVINGHRKGGRASAEPVAGQTGIADLCGHLKPAYDVYQASMLAYTLKYGGGIASAAYKVLVKTATIGLLNSLIINDIEITEVPPGKLMGETHYGLGPHIDAPNGGQPLELGINVKMPWDPGDIIVKCGWMTGLKGVGDYVKGAIKVPPGGNLPGVPVEWEDRPGAGPSCGAPHKALADHGTPILQGATDGSGNARFTLYPDTETLIGVGKICHDDGVLFAKVDVQKYFGGKFLSFSPNLYALLPPMQDFLLWYVDYHHAHGYKFSSDMAWTDSSGGYGYDTVSHVEGHVCGEDPWKQPWTFKVSGDYHSGYGTEGTFDEARSDSFGGTGSSVILRTARPAAPTYRDGTILNVGLRIINEPPYARMHLEPLSPREGAPRDVRIEEANC